MVVLVMMSFITVKMIVTIILMTLNGYGDNCGNDGDIYVNVSSNGDVDGGGDNDVGNVGIDGNFSAYRHGGDGSVNGDGGHDGGFGSVLMLALMIGVIVVVVLMADDDGNSDCGHGVKVGDFILVMVMGCWPSVGYDGGSNDDGSGSDDDDGGDSVGRGDDGGELMIDC